MLKIINILFLVFLMTLSCEFRHFFLMIILHREPSCLCGMCKFFWLLKNWHSLCEDIRPKMQFRPLLCSLYFSPFFKVSSDTYYRAKRHCLMLKIPFFYSFDKSQSDFSRLTSEKMALTSEKNASTSEKYEWHIIWSTMLTQLGFQCASDDSSAA